MRRFLIMRHAKSSWDTPGLPDHDRPLNKRGRAAATAMGRWMAAEGLVPDAVLLSSARRAVETWERASAEWPERPLALPDRALYMAWPQQILEALRGVDAEARTVLLVNHQPSISALAELLARPPVAPECARAFEHFPTAAIAEMHHEANWAEAGPRAMRFARFQVPKELPAP